MRALIGTQHSQDVQDLGLTSGTAALWTLGKHLILYHVLCAVLAELGVNGSMLQIIKSLCANDNAAVHTLVGISEV